MNSRELVTKAVKAIREKKGNNIIILQMKDLSALTDYYVLANGNSRVQTQAIADEIKDEMAKVGISFARKEGYAEGRWILLDFGNVIVHIFQEEEREFYSLERLWGDAKRVPCEE